MSKIKVLIVDDSALVRKILTEILNSDEEIEVVGTAQDPLIARDKIKQLKPDVITLDVEMPRMDGVTFLRNLMRLHPLPVVMISSLTEKGADITFDALEAGAIDFVAKPKIDVKDGLQEYTEEIVEKVKSASKAKVGMVSSSSATAKPVEKKLSADSVIQKKTGKKRFKTTDQIIALGASTGGTEAIKEVLIQMPPDSPGMVISQHIPEAFSGPFAERMDGVSAMTVCEAKDGQQILPGHVYIAPGSHHLLVERNGAQYICRLNDGERVNRHKPSVDVMFRSVAQNVGPNAIGVILTGMGDDGAKGLLEMKDTGAKTMIQDEKTSVVWGMPGSAAKLGAADNEYPLNRIATNIMKLME
ncbi:Chemotaxis response regulator protein-glutamate methylesterase CheB [hydrothermal vent metagenome]|uniref:protein-glutamate methylesterase n=1 Tax=hydrothermal vent metagenome TaxID=652676 RepID=A0A3B1AZF4_9ZZZZ